MILWGHSRKVEMRIYIAGPYTNGDVAVNVKKAIEAGDFVCRYLGHAVFIPHLTHFWHMLIPGDYEFWLRVDVEWLEVCDAVLRLPGESKGADREVKLARGMGKSIYTSISQIPMANQK